MATGIALHAEEIIQSLRTNHLLAPGVIVFGSRILEKSLKEQLCPWRGKKAVVVFGRRSAKRSGLAEIIDSVCWSLRMEMIPFFGVYREPTTEIIDQGTDLVREHKPDIIIGLGGGSVMDCAKVLAAMALNPGRVVDYLEGVGAGPALERDPLPLILVPTTAGTGAEVTCNAVVCDPVKKYKKSMRDARMMADVVIIDPYLTKDVPSKITAVGGMDTMTQLIEPCLSLKKRAETTELAFDMLPKLARAIVKACDNPENRGARDYLSLASFVSGICLSNAGLGMVHGVAAALGAVLDMPHGAACGMLLPYVLDFNKDVCKADMTAVLAKVMDEPAPDTGTIADGIKYISKLNRRIGIPVDLKSRYLKEDIIQDIATRSMGNSMSANPQVVTVEQVVSFLKVLC